MYPTCWKSERNSEATVASLLGKVPNCKRILLLLQKENDKNVIIIIIIIMIIIINHLAAEPTQVL